MVGYVLPAATDNVDANVSVICVPGPGSIFAMGDTIVTCHAADAAGNLAIPTTFIVHVRDTTPPVPDIASLPTSMAPCSVTIEATPTATDSCDGKIVGTTSDPLQYSTQGSLRHSLDLYRSGRQRSRQDQSVIVRDTSAPEITVSAAECVLPEQGKGRRVNKLTVTAMDNCSDLVLPQITRVELFNNGGDPVLGTGLYEIVGTAVFIKSNGNGWSVQDYGHCRGQLREHADGPGHEAAVEVPVIAKGRTGRSAKRTTRRIPR